jgi:hypothetical protein
MRNGLRPGGPYRSRVVDTQVEVPGAAPNGTIGSGPLTCFENSAYVVDLHYGTVPFS